MNNDLINRSALIEEFEWLKMTVGSGSVGDIKDAIERIKKAPAVDAEPVRLGRWEDIKGAIRCSECQEKPLYDYHGRLVLTRWCHACGVKMWKEIKSENH